MAASQTTEGMVAIVRGAGEAGVSVSMINGNKRYNLTPTEIPNTHPLPQQRPILQRQQPQPYQEAPYRNPALQPPYYPQPQQQPVYNYAYPYPYPQGPMPPIGYKVNAGMVTDHNNMVKYDSGVQACDGRYTTTYRSHHCHISPTSPEPLTTEFPPQKPILHQGHGHFEVGGSGSGATPQVATRSTTFRGGPMTWTDRGSVCLPKRWNHPDPFVSSLRKYPLDTLSPERSSEIVERLINYTQARNASKTTSEANVQETINTFIAINTFFVEDPEPSKISNSSARISNLEAFNLSKSLFTSQNCGQNKNIYDECRSKSPGRSRNFVEDTFGHDTRYRNDDKPYLANNRNPEVRFKLNLSPNRRVASPTQRNNKESNSNPATVLNMTNGGPATLRNKRLLPALEPVEEIETDAVQTFQSTASYTDLSHNQPDHIIRRTKSFELILTQSAEKFRMEILGCFQGISLIPSSDPKERLLRQGLLKKLTRKLNKLCEIYKGRYTQENKLKIQDSHTLSGSPVPVICDKRNFGATLRTLIEPPIIYTNRQDTNVYLVEVPDSSQAFNRFNAELNNTVKVWLDSIELYAPHQEKQKILEHFLIRLKMLFADRPTSQTQFRDMLKAEIILLLDCLPLSKETNQVMYKNRYCENLLDKLLPTVSKDTSESQYNEVDVYKTELETIVSSELAGFLQQMRNEVYDYRYLQYVKKDLYEILCDALVDIFKEKPDEIHTDLVIFLQESLSVTEIQANEMAQSIITSIRNLKGNDKTKSKVKSCTSLAKTSGNYLVYVSRSQDKFVCRNDRDERSASLVSVFELSRGSSDANISQYQNEVSIQIDEWLDSLRVSNIENRTQAVNELAADIVDRKRYLELNLSAKPPNNDIDYLKYQIFKWINKSGAENNQQTIDNARGLMQRIVSIRVPESQTQNQSRVSSSRRNSSQNGECCRRQSDVGSASEFDRIKSMFLGWLQSTPLYRQREQAQQAEQENILKKLAQVISNYKKSSNLSKTHAELPMINMILQHIRAIPLDNGKHFCCMKPSIVEATARNLYECLEEGIFSPSSVENFNLSDHFLRNTIEDWIQGLPFEPFKDSAEADLFRERQEDFIQLLKNSRSACCSRRKIITDIESFLMSMPFDCKMKCDDQFLKSETIKLLQMLEVVPVEDVQLLRDNGYDSFMGGLGPTSSKEDIGFMTSSESSLALLQMTSKFHKTIEDWAQGISITGKKADKARKNLVKKLTKEIEKIANNPRAVADRFLLEDMLEPIIDKLLDTLPQNPELSNERHAKKVALMQAIGDHFATPKQKSKHDLRKTSVNAQADHKLNEYKDFLRALISSVIPSDNPSVEANKRKILNVLVALKYPHSTTEEKREVLHKLDRLIDETRAASPTLRARPREEVIQHLMAAIDRFPQPDKKGSSATRMHSLGHISPEVARAGLDLENLVDDYIDKNYKGNNNLERLAYKQALLDTAANTLEDIGRQGLPMDINTLRAKIIDALKKIKHNSRRISVNAPEDQKFMDDINRLPPPEKKTHSATRMHSLEHSRTKISTLGQTLPISPQQARIELDLENLVDDYVDKNYRGNNNLERLAYKQALLDTAANTLENIGRQGLSIDINTLRATIIDALEKFKHNSRRIPVNAPEDQKFMNAINRVPPPDKKVPSTTRMHSLEHSLTKIGTLPISPMQSREDLGLENLVDDYVDKNYKGNNDVERLAYKQALLDTVAKTLEDIGRQGLSMDIDTLRAKMIDAMKLVHLHNQHEFSASNIAPEFRKVIDDLNQSVSDWCHEMSLPATVEEGNKLVSNINEALTDPKMRDDSFLFQTIAENEIDSMLDSLPQSAQQQANNAVIKKNLIKNLNAVREKAKGEHAVHDYVRTVGNVISNFLPSQCGNPDIAATKEKLADTFKEWMFEPSSPSQKKKALKKFNALVDEFYEATPSCVSQSKEQVRRRLFNALKKIPPPPKRFMANELAESILKREVSAFFHDVEIKPQSQGDKDHINKIKSALAKVLHEKENHVPENSEEYEKQIKNTLTKWAQKLPLNSNQESQLPCMIDKFFAKLKTSYRKRRDNLVAYLNEDEESASEEEEAVCWKCKRRVVCRRPTEFRKPPEPCKRPSNFYIPPEYYLPPPDYYIPPSLPFYPPIPDCFVPPEYQDSPESYKAREHPGAFEKKSQSDFTQPRECLRQPENGKPQGGPNQAETKKPIKLLTCRKMNSPSASINSHNCFVRPPFCPKCYALGRPCNEHKC